MIVSIIPSQRRDLGGFEVGRILPHIKHRSIGPFVFLDHLGPAYFPPGAVGLNVRPHPHIGLSTVTYLFEGCIRHYDSLGSNVLIRPTEVNWMTAGRGIVHSERTDADIRAAGVTQHGLQAWVALPEADEDTEPSFSHHGEADLPSYRDGGLSARLIAGTAFGATAKVKTHSPLFYVHWELETGVTGGVPAEHPERAVYVVRGRVEIDGQELEGGTMAVLKPGGTVPVKALQPSTVALLGGEPLGHRYIWWNLVSSKREKIEAAKEAWKNQQMTLPPDDDQEFIPLPAEVPH